MDVEQDNDNVDDGYPAGDPDPSDDDDHRIPLVLGHMIMYWTRFEAEIIVSDLLAEPSTVTGVPLTAVTGCTTAQLRAFAGNPNLGLWSGDQWYQSLICWMRQTDESRVMIRQNSHRAPHSLRNVNETEWRELMGSKQPKIEPYYFAVRWATGNLIPCDVGTGSSLSHLCDQHRCFCPSHLTIAYQHVDNMDRQRCLGTILIVANGSIIQEVLCGHANGQRALSCKKVRVIQLDATALSILGSQLAGDRRHQQQ